jgi:hypothetical protein
VFTDPLPNNRRPIVAGAGFRGNVFSESLPSNGSIRHNMKTRNTFYEQNVEFSFTKSLYDAVSIQTVRRRMVRMADELKGFGRKCSWLIEILSRYFLGRTE